VKVALLGEILVAGSIAAAVSHFTCSYIVVFAAMEHLAFASGIVAIASEIGVLHWHRHLWSVHLR
jgi:molybdenum-dependent DNA-binding transcriptional regulator ModE